MPAIPPLYPYISLYLPTQPLNSNQLHPLPQSSLHHGTNSCISLILMLLQCTGSFGSYYITPRWQIASCIDNLSRVISTEHCTGKSSACEIQSHLFMANFVFGTKKHLYFDFANDKLHLLFSVLVLWQIWSPPIYSLEYQWSILIFINKRNI